MLDFATTFKELTDNDPFPWQTELYRRLLHDQIPKSCNLPTGLGKTSLIALWLIAWANDAKIARRLVYVVNRRTVVDQTTNEVEKYQQQLHEKPNLAELRKRLGTLGISTLRGQFADNRAWSVDPARPAVICGTVDMIGSRLLFSGYGIGMKAKPLHAAFLGQDALLIHDEAHLEPAFHKLILDIEKEQQREPHVPWPKFRVLELTATSRGSSDEFGLTEDDKKNEIVQQRINATKKIFMHELSDEKKLADQIADRALSFKTSGRAVLIFVRTVLDVIKIREKLAKEKLPVETLTGTMRGKERDELASQNRTFARFAPKPSEGITAGTVYLVCTSAGEVGVNISADHLVCDLSTFESMAQRFGRVNRFGQRDDSEIHVVCPGNFKDDAYDFRRKKTQELLSLLRGDGSPDALGKLPASARQAAFAPTPDLLPATDLLFDAWALTTIRDTLPGRPPVEPFLHGLPQEWELPETRVAWREEVDGVTGDLLKKYQPKNLLEEYPLLPHEFLREPTERVFDHLQKIAHRHPEKSLWFMDESGAIEMVTLKEIAKKENKNLLEWMTVLLPPSVGGLLGGMLQGDSTSADDVSATSDRKRVWNFAETPADMHLILSMTFFSGQDDESETHQTWQWFEVANEGSYSAQRPVEWAVHVDDVVKNAAHIVDRLPLPEEIRNAVKLAAKYHDHGKRRRLFQRILGNSNYPHLTLAKSGKKGGRIEENYRHEFGSLLDIRKEPDFCNLQDNSKELVLHLIATHHGRARPHFPTDEAFDPENNANDTEQIACEVPRRFARLQRQWGRWGLAYLESLLRAADWAASASPSRFLEDAE